MSSASGGIDRGMIFHMARTSRENVGRASRLSWTPWLAALLTLLVATAGCDHKSTGPQAGSSASSSAIRQGTAPTASEESSILLRTCRCAHYEAGKGKSFKVDKTMTIEFLTEKSEQQVPEAYPGAWWCVVAWKRFDQGEPPADPLVKVDAPGLTWLDEKRESVPFAKSGRVPPPGEDHGHKVIFLGNPPYEKTLTEIVSALESRPRMRGRLCGRARDLAGELGPGRARAEALEKRFLRTGETGVIKPSELPKLFGEVSRYCHM